MTDITHEKALEFLQPFMEKNIFYLNIVYILIAIAVLGFIITGLCYSKKMYKSNDDGFIVGLGALFIIIFLISITYLLCIKIENYDMKKFPISHYRKYQREFIER